MRTQSFSHQPLYAQPAASSSVIATASQSVDRKQPRQSVPVKGLPGTIEQVSQTQCLQHSVAIARFWDDLDAAAYGFMWLKEARVTWSKNHTEPEFYFTSPKLFLYMDEKKQVMGMAWCAPVSKNVRLKTGEVIPKNQILEVSMVVHQSMRGRTLGRQLMEQRQHYILENTHKNYLLGRVDAGNTDQLKRLANAPEWEHIGTDNDSGMELFIRRLVRPGQSQTMVAGTGNNKRKASPTFEAVSRTKVLDVERAGKALDSAMRSASSSSLSSLDEAVFDDRHAGASARSQPNANKGMSAFDLSIRRRPVPLAMPVHDDDEDELANHDDDSDDEFSVYTDSPSEGLSQELSDVPSDDEEETDELFIAGENTKASEDSDGGDNSGSYAQSARQSGKQISSLDDPDLVRHDKLDYNDPSLVLLRAIREYNAIDETRTQFSENELNKLLGWKPNTVAVILSGKSGHRVSDDRLRVANNRIKYLRDKNRIIEGIPRRRIKPSRSTHLHLPPGIDGLVAHEGRRHDDVLEARWARRWEKFTDAPRRIVMDIQRMNRWRETEFADRLGVNLSLVNQVFRDYDHRGVTALLVKKINGYMQDQLDAGKLMYVESGASRPEGLAADIFCWPKGVRMLHGTGQEPVPMQAIDEVAGDNGSETRLAQRLREELDQAQNLSQFDLISLYNQPLSGKKLAELLNIAASTQRNLIHDTQPQRVTAAVRDQMNTAKQALDGDKRVVSDGTRRSDVAKSSDNVLYWPPHFDLIDEVTVEQHAVYLMKKVSGLSELIAKLGDVPRARIETLKTLNHWKPEEFGLYFRIPRKNIYIALQKTGLIDTVFVDHINATINKKCGIPGKVVIHSGPAEAVRKGKHPRDVLFLPSDSFRLVSHEQWVTDEQSQFK